MKNIKVLKAFFLFLFLFLAGIVPAQAATRTWIPTSGTNNWFDKTNWSPNDDYPRAGDVVVITNASASVLLTNSTEYLSSIMISNTATLIFSNWNTKLSATNVYVRTNATVTLPGAFTTNAGVMSNNIYIVCSNIMIDAGGSINADYLGYARGMTQNTPGNGPGAAPVSGPAGYGGFGGGQSLTYGSTSAPVDPGSGGRHGNNDSWPGGHGGGAVRIEADGTVLVNGIITANGRSAGNYGSLPGSGGSVLIRCYTFAGTNVGAKGMISANGGNCADSAAAGGGRIAVIYTNVAPSTAPVICSAAGGIGPGGNGDIGTLYFPNTNILTLILAHSGQLIIPGMTSWSSPTLIVSNGWMRFPVEDFAMTVANGLTIMGSSGKLELGGNVVTFVGSYRFIYTETNGPTLTCGSLTLTNGGSLYLNGGRTNLNGGNCAARVTVSGDVMIYSNSWIFAGSHPTNAKGVFFDVRALTIVTSNSGINADTRGWSAGYAAGNNGYGPGGGAGGGSYGGQGGGGISTYGSVSAPIDPGSGGKTGDTVNRGGNGGGGIRIQATDNVVVNGIITANGGSRSGYSSGGGSGGGIYIVCNTIAGTNGLMSTDGGYGQGGGGGGGRIAVLYTNVAAQNAAPVPDIIFSAAGSPPDPGNASVLGDIGTLYFPDNRFLTETIRHKGQWAVSGFTNWAPNNLTITNGWIRFNPAGFRLAVSNQLTIVGTGPFYHKLELSNAWLTCGGNLTLANASLILYREMSSGRTLACGGNFLLTNNAVLYVYSGATNTVLPNYGALVDVTGDMTLGGTNCWIYPTADSTNGGSVLFRMGNLTITSNSGFNADSYLSLARGYAANYGPGKGGGPNNAGGGYGGLGGGASVGYGQTYGSSNAPVDPGSGGTQYGLGGGSIRIVSSKTMTFSGTLTANGVGQSGYSTAGGSGGGVYVQCKDFAGTSGLISAVGGTNPTTPSPAQGGGGGGGRIAVWRMRDQSSGCIATVTGGLAAPTTYPNGNPGTIVWGWTPPPGTWFVIH